MGPLGVIDLMTHCNMSICSTMEYFVLTGARCSSVVRAFTHSAMGHQIDPSWGEPIELFLVPASAP